MKGFGIGCSGLFTQRDSGNLRIFSGWMLSAALVFALATVLIGGGLIPRAVAWLLTAVTAVVMILGIRSYLVFLREADELLRKIQVEGLALGFGAGATFMLVYGLLERLGLPGLRPAEPILVMVVFWALGQWIGMRRYAGEDES
jgi:hypothetical protein